MKVISSKKIRSKQSVKVIDCYVDEGYLQGSSGSMPDVDCDFQGDRRQEVKQYLEDRYNHDGKQRVFSAGTMTTLKMKAVLKDVSRIHHVPVNIVNYITKIIDDDKTNWTGLFCLAATNRRVRSFIQDYPDVIEDIRSLMFQPRSSSIHASAILVTPDTKDGKQMECFDYTPIKKVDGVLVSEFDGYTLDSQGLLKNDCLGIKELSKLQAIINICNTEYNANVTFQGIVQSTLDDPKVYDLLKKGYTQNVFQFSSKGITQFLMDMKPTEINDLIAANALYRPAMLESGSAKRYVDCKRGDVEPVYLWGTYEILKDTFAQMVYQEDLSRIAVKVGGFTLAEGVKLVKFISKKKQDKIFAMKDKFMNGAKKNGCPDADANEIWKTFEVSGSYCFNKSHATAYAITAYAGAWLKVNYPTAFYNVALQWASDDDIPNIMNEMDLCSIAKIVQPDINESDIEFYTDYKNNVIYWSLTRIKFVSVKSSKYIIDERKSNGNFDSIDNFIDRVFKYKLKKYEYWDDPDNQEEAERCPVNARVVRNMIMAGCFDKIENVKNKSDRFAILDKAAQKLGFSISEDMFPEELRDKDYFWAQQQIAISGIGTVDYKRIYDSSEAKKSIAHRAKYTSLRDVKDGTKVSVCASIAEIEEKKFVSKQDNQEKTFCRLLLLQNNSTIELVIWDEDWQKYKPTFCCGHGIGNAKNKLFICSCQAKHNIYSGGVTLQLYKSSIIQII